MKIINILFLSLKFMYVRKRRLLLNFIFCVIAFYAIIQIVMSMGISYVFKNSIEEVLNKDPSRTYSIDFKEGFPSDGSKNEASKEIASFIAKLEDVDSHGYFTVNGDEFTELVNNNAYRKKMKEVYSNTQSEDFYGCSSVVYMEPTAINLCKVEVCEGTADITYNENSETVPLLVGHSLKDVLPIGTVITEETFDVPYKVVGILKKNSNWIEVGDASFGYTSSWGNNLDGMLVAPINPYYFEALFEDIAQTYYFNLEDDIHVEEVINKIQDKANELGLNASVYSVSEKINEMMKEWNSINKLRVLIVAVSILIMVILLTASYISYLVKHKSEFGILFANGMDSSSLIKMVLIENISLLILSGTIAYCYSLYDFLNGLHWAYFMTDYNLLTGKAIEYLMITIIFIFVLSSLFSCIYLCRIKPVDLIGGYEE